MAGSYGCLGVLTEVSLKVLPKPRQCLSIRLDIDCARHWPISPNGAQPLPISAACHDGDSLYLRLEGGEGSVTAAHQRLGGEPLDSLFWRDLNEQRSPFFDEGLPLWRLSLPNNLGALDLPARN